MNRFLNAALDRWLAFLMLMAARTSIALTFGGLRLRRAVTRGARTTG